jgi:hypothetical protein
LAVELRRQSFRLAKDRQHVVFFRADLKLVHQVHLAGLRLLPGCMSRPPSTGDTAGDEALASIVRRRRFVKRDKRHDTVPKYRGSVKSFLLLPAGPDRMFSGRLKRRRAKNLFRP